MKYWLSHLPLEVWVDVYRYPWISRKDLGRIVDRFSNRKYAKYLQFYLHEWGRQSIGILFFETPGLMKNWNPNGLPHELLEYPQTAMPENIKFFQNFHINYFDNRAFNFFWRIQSILTADTKLDICCEPAYEPVDPNAVAGQVHNARTILDHLLPLIDGIHTLKTDNRMMPILQSIPPEKFRKIKVFDVTFTRFEQTAMHSIMQWLTLNNEPKLLRLWCHNNLTDTPQVYDRICEEFRVATAPSTFAVVFCNFNRPDFTSGNGIEEQLNGMRKEESFVLYRHQANAGDELREWLVQIGHENARPHNNFVVMADLDEDGGAGQEDMEDSGFDAGPSGSGVVQEENEAEDEKPCTSRKRHQMDDDDPSTSKRRKIDE